MTLLTKQNYYFWKHTVFQIVQGNCVLYFLIHWRIKLSKHLGPFFHVCNVVADSINVRKRKHQSQTG